MPEAEVDALIAVGIVALAGLWLASRLFRRREVAGPGGCSSGCGGCALARRGASGAAGCAAAVGAPSRPGAATGRPLPPRGREIR